MKFKLWPTMYWFSVVGSGICISFVILAFLIKTPWIILIDIPLIFLISCRMKDYLSIVHVRQDGFKVTIFGRVWFTSTWKEIVSVAKFSFPTSNVRTYCYILAKSELPFTRDMFFWGEPMNAKLNGTGIFIFDSKSSSAYILEHFSSNLIMDYGYIKSKTLKSK